MGKYVKSTKLVRCLPTCERTHISKVGICKFGEFCRILDWIGAACVVGTVIETIQIQTNLLNLAYNLKPLYTHIPIFKYQDSKNCKL
jgi:hypothetical protein